ncbi:MAG: class I SAM-dependent methyltransferase, partial [Terriglobia bacterium]
RRESEQVYSHEVTVASAKNVRRYMNPPATTRLFLEYAFHLLGDIRGKTILDVGCGGGENSILLAHRGATVLSLDISQDLCQVASRRMEVNGFVPRALAASAHSLPLPDGSVDVVFGAAVLHHLELKAASQEIFRIVRPGGWLIFSEPLRDSKLLSALRSLVPKRADLDSPYERPLRLSELFAFSSPFAIEHVRFFGLPPSRLADFTGLRLPGLDAAEYWALTHVKSLAKFATFAVIKLKKNQNGQSVRALGAVT